MYYIFSLLIFLLTGCGSVQKKTHVVIAEKLSMEFMTLLSARDGLHPCGYGGAMMGDIQVFNLGFETEESLTKNQMRILIVEKAEEFITFINSNIEIRPYLHDYPITVNNIYFWIIYNCSKLKKVKFPHVVHAQITRGKILYNMLEYDSAPPSRTSESYEDALKIFYGQEPSCSNN